MDTGEPQFAGSSVQKEGMQIGPQYSYIEVPGAEGDRDDGGQEETEIQIFGSRTSDATGADGW